MRASEMTELVFTALAPAKDDVRVDVTAEIIHGGQVTEVRGFYAGDDTWKIRFLPGEPGEYTVHVHGLLEKECAVTVEPALPDQHGVVKADGTAFRFEDGSPFHPFGTTVYALVHQDPALEEQTLETLSEAPFNKVRMCVFPKHYDFNHNEPQFYPFRKAEDGSWDPSHPDFRYWDHLESVIARLGAMGVQVDLILFHPYDRWGFNGMGQEKDLVYLDYLLRRLSAFPNIWWSLANEYELCSRSEEDWFAIEKFIAEHDPYRHLLSCHNIFKFWDATRPLTTHASIQSKSFHRLGEWVKRFGKPVMLDECCYEGNIEHFWGCITGREMTRRFWRCVASGAYCTHGETFYSDDEVLWWARGGKLKGESAPRIAFCRQVTEGLPGHLEKEPGFYDRLIALSRMDPESQEKAIPDSLPEGAKRMIHAFLESGENQQDASAAETVWYGHIGNDVFLHFYDTRPISRETLKLPEGRHYRLELLDTWNMTRETVATGVSGEYTVSLPGREDMALLVLAED